jgi:hypothetical protein
MTHLNTCVCICSIYSVFWLLYILSKYIFLSRMQCVNMKPIPIPIPVGTLTVILYIVVMSFSHIICSSNSLMKGFQENTALL